MRDRKGGWRHIDRRHGPLSSRAYGCMKRVLANAAPKRMGSEWRYRLQFRGGDYAEVRVDPSSKTINSAYAKGSPGGYCSLGRLHQQEDEMTTTTGFLEGVAATIREAQQWMVEGPDVEEEERWGAALRLIAASIGDGALVLCFTEPDGRRINYRWLLHDDYGFDALADQEEALRLLSSNFQEDVLTCERSEPDADGVRWFGDRPGEDENTPEVPPGDEIHWSPSD
jgi:hypothetical protein